MGGGGLFIYLFVSNNIKTTKLIGPNICVASYITPGKVYCLSNGELCLEKVSINPIPGPLLTFFEDNSKSIGLRLFKFFNFLTKKCHLNLAQSGAIKPTAWMPYFTFTRLNLYLDLRPFIAFRLFKALWKALN